MNSDTIKQALKIQQRIDTLTQERDTLLNGSNGSNGAVAVKTKRPMSESTKAKIRAAQKRRWKALKTGK